MGSTEEPIQLDPEAQQYSPQIHILGLGNLGKLFSHALARLSPAPRLTILTHRPGLPYAFAQSGGVLTLKTSGKVVPASGIVIEVIQQAPQTSAITNLIVCTKAMGTAGALQSVAKRLGPNSTILFTQNGLGVVDEVNQSVFPDPKTRPNYLAAIVVHGVYGDGPFGAVHAGLADMKIGHLNNGAPGRSGVHGASYPHEARMMLQEVSRAPSLAAQEVSPEELVFAQLEKLIANACINPLSAIFQVNNGGLLTNEVVPLRRRLTAEASEVFNKYLKESGLLNEQVKLRFTPSELEKVVLRMTTQTASNYSSMYQDVKAGRETEVRYINGWFVNKGREYGIDTTVHERVVSLIQAKEVIDMGDIREHFS
jgi:2-dehydropantoate 2-reductase